ncbi:MAG: nucleoside triphosphate pyrophosphohydrolase [Verrucomicrobiia bacterium]
MNASAPIDRLLEIMAQLRAPDGCPWDREQTHLSLKTQLVEECYELLEAIDAADDALLQEELGDVLLHLVFHSQIARERGAFTFPDVVNALCEKLIRRHPHVFGTDSLPNSAAVLAQWHQIKAKEKPQRASALDGVPAHLPALMKCQELQKKAARVGFDWPNPAPVWDKIHEELNELQKETDPARQAEELGDLLFSIVNLARHLHLDAEEVARQAATKFSRRFRALEADVRSRQQSLEDQSLAELDAAWERVKTGEATSQDDQLRSPSPSPTC